MTVAHESRVVVVGQGYVGLPLAVRAVEVGHTVVGFDLDKDRVDRLRRGASFIDDITDADLAAVLETGRYTASDDAADLAGFTVAVVCVPGRRPTEPRVWILSRSSGRAVRPRGRWPRRAPTVR